MIAMEKTSLHPLFYVARSQNKVIYSWEMYEIAMDVGEAELYLHASSGVLLSSGRVSYVHQ